MYLYTIDTLIFNLLKKCATLNYNSGIGDVVLKLAHFLGKFCLYN